MSPTPTHLSPLVLDRYARRALGPTAAPAVELHLQHCATCRAAVNDAVLALEPDRAGWNWSLVEAELDVPRRGVLERLLVRARVPADTLRLMAATPSLRRSWFIAIGVAMLFALAAANPDRPGTSLLWFLALAPLVPVVGVALAYGPGVDPSYEITLAAPVSGFRLVLVRASAVLAASVVLGGLVSLLLLPRHDAMVAAWLLPALALSAVCLVLMTVVPSRVAAALVGAGWATLCIAVGTRASDQLVLFRGPGQLGFALVALVAAAVLLGRRASFDRTPRSVTS